MGEVADTLTKKKKKGRPSLLDLQKRALKQQQLLHQNIRSVSTNPNSLNPAPNSAGKFNRDCSNSEDDDDERMDKKHRLLHGLNSNDHPDSSNFKNGGFDIHADADASIRRGKIVGIVQESDVTGKKASKATDILQRSLVESDPSTPLPDKMLLVFILDRLQQKDTYGVYSNPVDPEELPYYHEIIKNPMDFSTLRKKLESGTYATLEQFEQDVFLICTNAMEYNSADTVYFRQARAILEMAKKDFKILRQESDGEEPVSLSQQPKVVKRGRPPGTGLKKHTEPSSVDCNDSEISADAAAQTCGFGGLAGAYNLRKTPPNRFRQAETSVRINHNSANQSGLLIDWEKEFPPSVVKAVNKYGMKNVDEDKRDTYNSTSLQETSVCTMLADDLKQLIPVGVKAEYGYARSLAQYAANLGPVAWKFVNKRIETVLPTGIGFGPGWVGENPGARPTQQQKCSNDLAYDDNHHSTKIMSPTIPVSSSIIGNKETAPATRISNQETDQLGPLNSYENNSLVRGPSGFNHNQSQVPETEQGLFSKTKQELDMFSPDLNAKLASPKSRGSNHQTSSSQHPDLALQL